MTTCCPGEPANQVHGYELHGYASMSEDILDVFGLLHLLLNTGLTVFTVHQYILLDSFPVVQSLECSICMSEANVTHMAMHKQQCCADQAVQGVPLV